MISIRNHNIRGSASALHAFGTSPPHEDVIILTETWNHSPNHLGPYRCLTCLAPSTKGRHRKGGGILLATRSLDAQTIQRTSHKSFQLLGARLKTGLIVYAAYLSPSATKPDRDSFIETLNKIPRGACVIVGDLNARSKTWDRTTNRNGHTLVGWCKSHNFRVHTPPNPTCITENGNSLVDICIVRGIEVTNIQNLATDQRTDHVPVTITLAQKSFTPTRARIPPRILQDKEIQDKVRQTYTNSLPRWELKMKQANTPAELDKYVNGYITDLVTPWQKFFTRRPARFKPGWTFELDIMAKKRSQLLKKAAKATNEQNRQLFLARARGIDRAIKQKFRANKKKTLRNQIEALTERPTADTPRLLAELLSNLSGGNAHSPHIPPEKFTAHMEGNQPPVTHLPILPFKPPRDFHKHVSDAIQNAKRGKAPGADAIQAEILKTARDINTGIITELWTAVGRLRVMPMALAQGLYAPIYKKGDTTDPVSYRPIALLSHIRKTISMAYNKILTDQYEFNNKQWGFTPGMATEDAITHASDHIRRGKNHIGVLDMSKAYDKVPRSLLLALLQNRLPDTTVAMATPLLQPLKMSTQQQKDNSVVALVSSGVPQGDVPSPTLFNIFLDPLLEKVEESVSDTEGTASGYCDDVIALAKTPEALQTMLNIVTEWAQENGMIWNVDKSVILSTSDRDFSLAGQRLRKVKDATYLGVTISATGILPNATIARYDSTMARSRRILMVLNKIGGLSAHHRRLIWLQLLQPAATYGEHLVPLTPQMEHKQTQLDIAAARFILNTEPPRNTNRAVLLAGIIPSDERRLIHQERRIAKALTSRSEAITADPSIRKPRKVTDSIRKLDNIRSHGPIGKHLQALKLTWPPATKPQEIIGQLRTAQQKRRRQILHKVNRHSTRPLKPTIPALYRSQPQWLQKRAIKYYLFRWPTRANKATPTEIRNLHRLLSIAQWTKQDETDTRRLVRTLRQREKRTPTTAGRRTTELHGRAN